MRTRTYGQTLVASLIVIAIIAILAAALYGGTRGAGGPSPRKDGKGATVLGLSKLKAQDEVCRSNLSQARAGVQVARTNADDAPPTKLEEIGIGQQFYKCPLGGEPYNYDPASGEVKCPHPGHEKY
jgi:hypothetical protein